MKPTPELEAVWSELPEGEYWKAMYYRERKHREIIQRVQNYIANATSEQLDELIAFLEKEKHERKNQGII